MDQNVIDEQETERFEQFSTEIIKQIERDDLELPLLPRVIWEVMDLSSKDNVNASRLSDLIHQDLSLAGHVLKVANSPAYLPRYPITSLTQAISRLGLTQLSEIAFCIALKGKVFRLPGYQDEIQHLWDHAAQTAYLAKAITGRSDVNAEGAFLSGLLHDIGKPLLLQIIVNIQKELKCKLALSTVRELMDAFHTQAGHRLVDAWRLVSPVKECIIYHHVYRDAPTCAEAVAVTHLADWLSYTVERASLHFSSF